MKRRRVFERAIFAIECAISIVGKKFVIIFVDSLIRENQARVKSSNKKAQIRI